MKKHRSTSRLVAYLTIIATGCFYTPAAAVELGLDFWHIDALENQIAESQNNAIMLEKEDQAVLGRMTRRNIVMKNLIAKRISLDEATNGFETLNRESPKSLRFSAFAYPGNTDRERAKNQALAHLKMSDLPGAKERHAELIK